MDAVRAEVKKLVDVELESANRKFPLFSSAHEGYAVIKEEAEEAQEALVETQANVNSLWLAVQQNGSANLNGLHEGALKMACEAIQIAAMTKKFAESIENWKKG